MSVSQNKIILTSDVTALSADIKASSTSEGAVGTVTLPSNALRIVGIGVSINNVMTTVNPLSGYFRIQISNKDVTPAKFVFCNASAVTSGAVANEPRIYQVNWEGIGNGVVTFTALFDVAQTGVTYVRGFVLFEKLVQ